VTKGEGKKGKGDESRSIGSAVIGKEGAGLEEGGEAKPPPSKGGKRGLEKFTPEHPFGKKKEDLVRKRGKRGRTLRPEE